MAKKAPRRTAERIAQVTLDLFNRFGEPIKTAFEGDFDTGNVRYKARERYSFGWSDPRGIYGSPGAA